MSLLYRAIWSDRRDDATKFARSAMERWVDRKTAGAMTLPDSGSASGQIVIPGRSTRVPEQRYDAEINLIQAVGDGSIPDALSATFIELKDDGSRWDTTLRSWTESGNGVHNAWLWVDVECVGPIDLSRLSIAAPLLAVDLIEGGTEPTHGGLRLSTRPTPVTGASAGEDLAGEITDPTRDLPIVVFSVVDDVVRRLSGAGYSFGDITDIAARRLAGVAVVYVADAAACWALTHSLGADFAVWGGAFRIYLANVDPAIPGTTSVIGT